VQRLADDALDDALAALAPPPPLAEVRPAYGLGEHAAKVERVLELIRAGDIYQANLTFPIDFRYDGAPLALYAALRARQPVAHGGVVATGEHWILSVSPELFVSEAGGVMTTRPMKGTCARGGDPAADAAAVRALVADPKQRAENLMIVDLLRNDLSRISTPGSVQTPALFTVETYPTLHTLTSTVQSRPLPGVGFAEKMAALFPCGSVVGAPKIRANEIIAELEARPRGVYTGAIGWLAPDGDLKLNVAIRTAVIDADGRGVYGVGGGIVADSDPAGEYQEALLKGRVLTELAEDYGLIETLRWTRAGFQRLAQHLDRLESSARRLGFAFDHAAAEATFHSAAAGWTAEAGERRVRGVLARAGGLTVTATVVEPAGVQPMTVGLATEPLDAADPFLRHKTTRRAQHERAFVEAAALGFDEALLVNRAGRVADASRNSVFLQRAGRLVTPPVRDGALPGALRAELIAAGRAMEGELTPSDLAAGRWFLGNSLHGLRPAAFSCRSATEQPAAIRRR
jgi:para-aminobenzoate synthetase/4-amino-4-deoxychorismate lyase